MPRILIALLLLCLAQAAPGASQGGLLTPLPNRPAAPDFRLMDMDDKVHQLSDYRGTVVIINFWATWCPPCRAEMPSMQRAWTQLKKAGIVMLAINVGEKAAAIRRFHKEYPVGFPLLLDLDSSTAESWPMRGLPTTFVVDPAGRLAYKAVGGREWDNPEILDQIRALKGSRAQPPG